MEKLNNSFKKNISILLTAVLLLAAAWLTGFSGLQLPHIGFDFAAEAATTIASGTCGENLTWTLDNEGTLTISGTGDMTHYTYSRSAPWRSNRSSIKKAVIADSVTSIGDYAFYYCDSLASVIFGENSQLTSIGDNVFYDCASLTSVTIPDSVTSIGNWAFFYCTSLASITIPDGMTSIGDSVFSGCESLASISIPDSVTSIGNSAFSSCSSLASITIPDSVTSIGSSAFDDCTNLASITIPDSVTRIGYRAFYDCTSLESVTFGENSQLTSIGDWAFRSCIGLASITIPDSVTSIGDSAFRSCDSLASITVNADNANYSSDADGVLFNKDKTTLIQYPIGNARTSYTIPDSVTSIGNSAFESCYNLASVTFDENSQLTSIGESAFYYCPSLASITIPDSVTSIGSGAFSNTAYYNDESNWLNGVLYIDNCLIAAKTDISSAYVINNDTRVIASGAFRSCDSLASITIPDSVTSIGNRAFDDCTNLASITIPDSVTEITYGAFCSCTSLTEITLPDSVTSIGNEAFYNCDNLASITIPDSVISIGSGAFSNTAYCNDESNWLNGVLYIDKCLIGAKTDISGAYVINNDTRVIASGAFFGCASLESVTISDSVTNIGGYAFSNCRTLSDVYYIGSEEEWNAVDIGPMNDSLLNATIHFVDMTPSFSDSEIVFVNEDGNLVSRVGKTAEDLLALAGEDASLVNNKGETLAETDKIGTGAVLTLADGTRYEIVVLGDIDGDGNITAGDARSALRNSVSLDVLAGVYLKAAKVNGEGPVNAGDARSILRASVGLDNPDEWYEKAAG